MTDTLVEQFENVTLESETGGKAIRALRTTLTTYLPLTHAREDALKLFIKHATKMPMSDAFLSNGYAPTCELINSLSQQNQPVIAKFVAPEV